MFFNLDKSTKQNLLNEYKQEALNFHQKKQEEKQKRIQEEREYLAKMEQIDKEANEKVFRERLKRKNEQMEEYQSMLLKTKNNIPGYRHNSNKNSDIVLNNWGGQEKNHQIQKDNISTIQPENNNNTNSEVNIIPQGDQSTPWRGRRAGYRTEDHLNTYLNDNRNDQELNNYIKGENQYKKQIYKDLLYSQFQEANNKNLNLYGTNDPLILERKRKGYLIENPYAKKNNYEFGKSTLSHNPITDPQNNINYNKYLKFSESANNIKINQNNNNMGNSNFAINNNYNKRPMDEFKSNNYDASNINMMNNNFNPIVLNQNNINNNLNSGMNQMGQNQSNGYINSSFRPTPSGERIRQAAASNFL
jgi:hypothetical protein